MDKDLLMILEICKDPCLLDDLRKHLPQSRLSAVIDLLLLHDHLKETYDSDGNKIYTITMLGVMALKAGKFINF